MILSMVPQCTVNWRSQPLAAPPWPVLWPTATAENSVPPDALLVSRPLCCPYTAC
ncbi:hypothetical protein M404DRAFT_321889 [Pisolithus tinctorius Marx 270]|uniref:Uncharacterized protein n=1 Tax=Pisolithus tinctorius Marx 270 TaxID=870435 RepID=A0A0C3KGF3_PISTI|nr:hypothetical protein M404DRAFT_321889 [Pisolithus tinctorius Marx 270]